QRAAARFAHDAERLGHQVVERFALGEAMPEFSRLGAQLLVAERLDRVLERVDLADDRAQPFQFAFVLGADDFGEERLEHLRMVVPARGYSIDCSMPPSLAGLASERRVPGAARLKPARHRWDASSASRVARAAGGD